MSFIALANALDASFLFTYFNPSGRYRLNLSNSYEREVAQTLLILNKEAVAMVEAGERADRSQTGNASCFRNESLSGLPFVWSEAWKLPPNGLLEFDFVYLVFPPDPKLQVASLESLMPIFTREDTPIELKLKVFKIMAEFLVLSAEQLGELIDLIDGEYFYHLTL